MIGFQSIGAKIDLSNAAYTPNVDMTNSTTMNHDVFQMRFSLNSCKFESPHINHPAHRLRKGSHRVIMDCDLPVESFATTAASEPQEKTGSFVSAKSLLPNDKMTAKEQSSSDSFSDDATTAEDVDERPEFWHTLTVRWLPDRIVFLLDDKVYRQYTQPQILWRMNQQLFCVQILCTRPQSKLDWYLKTSAAAISGNMKFLMASSDAWLLEES